MTGNFILVGECVAVLVVNAENPSGKALERLLRRREEHWLLCFLIFH